jgi:cAMP-specific phosphodiesterase 4
MPRVKDKMVLAWRLLAQEGLAFAPRQPEFLAFFCQLEWDYNKRLNPFHNLDHGVNVLHCCYKLTQTSRMRESFLPLELFSLRLAALCHDLDHTGRTNFYEIKCQSELALVYNDASVLENHHISTTFRLLRRQGCNFLADMGEADFLQLRRWVIKLILATDNQGHFQVLKGVEKILLESKAISISAEENRMELGGLVMHCSDFAGATKDVAVSQAWSTMVNLEFSNQYSSEVSLGLTPTSYFKDLHIDAVRLKNEVGFVSAIVQPTW